jgi:hypothetical protein
MADRRPTQSERRRHVRGMPYPCGDERDDPAPSWVGEELDPFRHSSRHGHEDVGQGSSAAYQPATNGPLAGHYRAPSLSVARRRAVGGPSAKLVARALNHLESDADGRRPEVQSREPLPRDWQRATARCAASAALRALPRDGQRPAASGPQAPPRKPWVSNGWVRDR